MRQYRAYVMDSVSSGQAIITSPYYPYAPCIHCVPHLSPTFFDHPYIPSFQYVGFFIYLYILTVYMYMFRSITAMGGIMLMHEMV